MEKRTIKVFTFSTMPALTMEGYDPNKCSATDYETDRAKALYDALGVSTKDEEYALAAHRDGRWALFGLTETGHRFAAEVLPFELHLVASAPNGGNPDASATCLGAFETKDAARAEGRRYLQEHPSAWLQVQDAEQREDGEDIAA